MTLHNNLVVQQFDCRRAHISKDKFMLLHVSTKQMKVVPTRAMPC